MTKVGKFKVGYFLMYDLPQIFISKKRVCDNKFEIYSLSFILIFLL